MVAKDTRALARPFSLDYSRTVKAYKGLIDTLKDELHQVRGPSEAVAPEQCSAKDYTMCEVPCASCINKVRALDESFLTVGPSSIDGTGLFSTAPFEPGTIILKYSGSEMTAGLSLLGDSNYVMAVDGIYGRAASGSGLHNYVNHSCSPNARLQKGSDPDGNPFALIIADEFVTPNAEVTVDYGDRLLSRIQCRCVSPFCRRRDKVLVLGMVQFCRGILVEELRASGQNDLMINPFGGQALAYLFKSRKLMSKQHARDMYRCQKMAEECNVSVFTMDMNNADHGNFDRLCHYTAAFETRESVAVLKSKKVCFTQIVLDYFYSPTSWTRDHWKPSFFKSILPQFAIHDILELAGTILLPFQPHVLDQVASHWTSLARYYKITIVYKGDHHRSVLWRGTLACDRRMMLDVFGKDPLQEEALYCSATIAELSPVAEARFRCIAHLKDARFLSLRRIL
jgi:hypothetical protein